MDKEIIESSPEEHKWVFEDYVNRRCMLSEVGNIKPDDGYAKRLARVHAAAAVRTLIDVAANSDQATARVKAANAILDRGFGRPEGDQRITLESHNASLQLARDEMPWISARRLLYQVQSQLAPDIEATRRIPVEDAAVKTPADPLKTAAASPADLGPTLPPTPSENAAAAPADIRKDYGPRGTARGK